MKSVALAQLLMQPAPPSGGDADGEVPQMPVCSAMPPHVPRGERESGLFLRRHSTVRIGRIVHLAAYLLCSGY